MKVLYYNWAPLNTSGVGGGVSVYMKNVLTWLKEHPDSHDIEPVFLSSGFFMMEVDAPILEKRFQ